MFNVTRTATKEINTQLGSTKLTKHSQQRLRMDALIQVLKAVLCALVVVGCFKDAASYYTNDFDSETSNFDLSHSSMDSPCGNWIPYKNETCMKLFTKMGLKTKNEGEMICRAMAHEVYSGWIPKLLTIKTEEKQSFVQRWLFEDLAELDSVWLDLEMRNDEEFQWNNERHSFYTNWVDQSLTESRRLCVEMESGEGVHERGKWVKVKCGRRNAVVCERTQPQSMIPTQNVLSSLLSEIERYNQTWEQKFNETEEKLIETEQKLNYFIWNAEQKLNESKQEIENLRNNPVPVGFIYVQLPYQDSPTTLWPQTSWIDIGYNYSGLFFRAEGGDAEPFGEVQEDNTRSLAQVYYLSNPTPLGDPYIPANGSWSGYASTGQSGNGSFYGLKFRLTTGEVRPRNTAVKIWQRIDTELYMYA